MHSIVVTIASERERTRLLMTNSERDLLKAILPPRAAAHPSAVRTVLEGLALWQQEPLSVVLVVDGPEPSSDATFLCDALGFGERTLHYEVTVAYPPERRKRSARRLGGMAGFDDLRLHRLEVMR